MSWTGRPRIAAALTVVLLSACASLTDLGAGIAFLELRGPAPATVAVGGTVTLSAIALDAQSDTIPAAFEWFTPDTLAVSVNRSSGAVTGRLANSSARIQARSGDVVSPFFILSVVAAPAP